MANPGYLAFEQSEYDRRLKLARETAADAGLSGCLLIAPESMYYLSGYDSWVSVNSPQALIFSIGSDAPTLIVRDVDLPLVTESAWVEDVRVYNVVTSINSSGVRVRRNASPNE